MPTASEKTWGEGVAKIVARFDEASKAGQYLYIEPEAAGAMAGLFRDMAEKLDLATDLERRGRL